MGYLVSVCIDPKALLHLIVIVCMCFFFPFGCIVCFIRASPSCLLHVERILKALNIVSCRNDTQRRLQDKQRQWVHTSELPACRRWGVLEWRTQQLCERCCLSNPEIIHQQPYGSVWSPSLEAGGHHPHHPSYQCQWCKQWLCRSRVITVMDLFTCPALWMLFLICMCRIQNWQHQVSKKISNSNFQLRDWFVLFSWQTKYFHNSCRDKYWYVWTRT